jgi:hypothetical protein
VITGASPAAGAARARIYRTRISSASEAIGPNDRQDKPPKGQCHENAFFIRLHQSDGSVKGASRQGHLATGRRGKWNDRICGRFVDLIGSTNTNSAEIVDFMARGGA